MALHSPLKMCKAVSSAQKPEEETFFTRHSSPYLYLLKGEIKQNTHLNKRNISLKTHFPSYGSKENFTSTIKKSLQVPKRLKNNTLAVQFDDFTASEINQIYHILRQVPQLQHLKLSLLHNQASEDVNLKDFAKSLRSIMPYLKSLEVKTFQCDRIVDQIVDSLGEALHKKCPKLEHLDLQIENNHAYAVSKDSFKGANINSIFKALKTSMPNLSTLAIKKLNNDVYSTQRREIRVDLDLKLYSKLIRRILDKLNNLELSVDYNTGIPANSFTALAHTLKKANCNIENLKLGFFRCEEIKDSDLQMLQQAITNGLSKLRQLSLSFQFCVGLTDEGIATISNAIGARISDLKQLELSCSDISGVGNEGLKALAENIARTTSDLEKLFVNFSCTGIDDVGVKAICKAVYNSLPYLKEVGLHFAECSKVTDPSFEALSKIFTKGATSLKKVDINLDRCGAKMDVGTVAFCRGISRNNLPNLESLTLRMNDLDDDGMINMTYGLKKFLKLKEIRLEITHDGLRITHEGMKCFRNALKQLSSHLESLHLNFEHTYNVKDDFVTIISEALCMHDLKLKHLELNFNDFTSVNDQSISNISKSLAPLLEKMDYLSLDFSNNNSLTGAAIHAIKNGLKEKLVNLKQVNLLLERCPNIPQEEIMGLANMFEARTRNIRHVLII